MRKSAFLRIIALLIGLGILLFALPLAVFADGTVIYVDRDATGANSGDSWADAYPTLQEALDYTNAHGGTPYEIWVAEGVYYPDEGGSHVDNAMTETFRISWNNVELYGGFAATETFRTQRDWVAHPTILSGDIDKNDGNIDGNYVAETWNDRVGSNAFNVMVIDGVTNQPITETTVIDGFTITAGYADHACMTNSGGGMFNYGAGSKSSPRLSNLIFSGNEATFGGGVFNDGSSGGESSPILTNVTFSGNLAWQGGGMNNDSRSDGESSPVLTHVVFSGNEARTGGGIFNCGCGGESSPVLTNVLFSGNRADNSGGGMYNNALVAGDVSDPVLTNVTFAGNAAGNEGGGMTSSGSGGGTSSPLLVNCILWGNTAATGSQIHNSGDATPTITYSDIEGGCPASATCGAGMLPNNDPQFIAPVAASVAPTTAGSYRLQMTSPAIDAGNNLSVTVATDLDDNPRKMDVLAVADTGIGPAPIVDMGVYEALGAIVTMTHIITPVAGPGGSIDPGVLQTVNHGGSRAFTIKPDVGYHIADVEVDDVSIGATSAYTFTNVIADHTITATFAPNEYTLIVNIVGQGTVTRVPNQATYWYGDVVTLTATAASGWHFGQWRGDASGVLTQTTVTMTANRVVTATFIETPPAYYTLTLSVVGSGVVTPSVGTYSYLAGTVVDLSASPVVGWQFTGWSGDLTSNANPAAVTMDRDKVVTATFVVNTYVITPVAGPGGSIDPGTPQTVNHGGSRAFTINPDAGYHIANVEVDGVSMGATNAYTFTNVTADHIITATFAPNEYTLIVNIVGQGTVTRVPHQATYWHGDVVTLTATAASGWYFGQWSGDASGGLTQTTVTMTANRVVTATFIETPPVYYTLSLSAVGNGSLTPAVGTHSYLAGTRVKLSADPATGWRFTGWSGDLTGSTNPTVVTMDRDKAVTGTFAINRYVITPIAGPGGSISPGTAQTVNHGGSRAFTINPDTGYHVAGVEVDGVSIGTPRAYTFTNVTADHIITATFTPSEYTLVVNIVGQGTVARVPNQAHYGYGDVVTLTATSASGWYFGQWSGDASGGLTQTTVTMTANRVVTATFIETPPVYHTLTLGVAGNGSLTPDVGRYRYLADTRVRLSADPATGWRFTGWSGDLTGSASPTAVTMDRDKAVTGTFVIKTYVITPTAGPGGSISPGIPQTVNHGGSQVFAINPDIGYHIVDVEVDGHAIGVTNAYTFVNVTADHTISATFDQNKYTLTVAIIGQGAVTWVPSQTTYLHGDVVTLTATAASGWYFGQWSGDASGALIQTAVTMNANRVVTATFSSMPPTYYTLTTHLVGDGTIAPGVGLHSYLSGTRVHLSADPATGWRFTGWSGALIGNANPAALTMDQDKAVTGTFALHTYVITPIAGPGGSISPGTPQTVNHGGRRAFTITANPGYHIADVGVDDVSQGAVVSYTFVNVTADHIISATFDLNDVVPSLSISDAGKLEGNRGITTLGFTVTLSAPSAFPVTVTYNTMESTAKAGSDYTALTAAAPLVFAPGVTQHVVPITVYGDMVQEDDEVFMLMLSNPVNAAILKGHGIGTIGNDDFAGVIVTPTAGLTTTEDGGQATFNVRLTSQPALPVTITLQSADVTEGVVTPTALSFDDTPAALRFNAGNWATPQPALVTGMDDTSLDGDIAYTVQTRLTSADPFYALLNPDDVKLVNLDNEKVQYAYLPLVLHQRPPDLIVRSLTVSPGDLLVNQPATITMVIENIGEMPTLAPFWVDLYIDPDPSQMPPQVNQTWDVAGSQYGLAWWVTQTLASGEQFTLTSESYVADYSDWPGYFSCYGSSPYTHTLYGQVDSYSSATTYGTIGEADETNNTYGPVSVPVACPPGVAMLCPVSQTQRDFPRRP